MILYPADVEALRRYITDEIFIAMGTSSDGWSRRLLGPLFWLPANQFARLAASFDKRVEQVGICEAVRHLLPRFIGGVQASGAEQIPQEGPLIIVSNHPGAYDLAVIISCLPRDDLKIIVSGVPFLRGLPNTARHLIYVTQDAHVRMNAVRVAIRHLKAGGALLLFPSGKVDPDPAVLPGAHEALNDWSPSLDVILRRVPEAHLQVCIVSGVLASSCLRNPLVRLPKEKWRQQKLAEFFQVIQQMIFPRSFELFPRISFGKPFTRIDLISEDGSEGIISSVVERALSLLEVHTSSDAVLGERFAIECYRPLR